MTRLHFEIAQRYLVGKKSTNLINIITGICIFGIAIGTAALLLILSVFNGLENLLVSLTNPFNPDLKVTPIEGKFFEVSDKQLKDIKNIEGLLFISKSIEEVALFEYKGTQEIGVIKGVDEFYKDVVQLDTSINFGTYQLKKGDINFCVVESGIQNKLSMNIDNSLSPVKGFMPLKKKAFPGAKEFKTIEMYPSGVFSSSSDEGDQKIISNLETVQQLVQVGSKISALEIKTDNNVSKASIKKSVAEILGTNFKVKDRYQQDELTLKMVSIEKWIAFLITGITLVLIFFNLIGAIWMIVLDKQKDISILRSFGFTSSNIKQLFVSLGVIITGIGLIIGFVLALFIYFLQKKFGLIAFPDSFLIDAYPVQIRYLDFIFVSLAVLLIGFLASFLPSIRASKLKMSLKA